MSDNSIFDPGTGGDTYRSKDRTGVKTEIVAIDLNPAGAETLMAGVMPVSDNSGSLTVDNGGTFAVQDSQKIADNAGFTDGTTPVGPAGYIFDEVAGTALTENDVGAARMDSKRAQVLVIEDASTRGQRATVSAAGAVKVDGSAVTQPVSGTVTATGPLTDTQLRASAVPVSLASAPSTAVTNAGTFAVQDSEKVADNAGFTDGTTKVLPAGYIFDEVAGTALTENDAGAARMDSKRAQVLTLEDATTRGQRAAISAAGRLSVDASGVAVPITDNSGSLTVDAPVGTPAFVRLSDGSTAITALPVTDNSGSLTVDAPVGTPVFTTVTPSTTGGWSKITALAQTTTKKVIKASAGTFGGYYVYNPNAVVSYIQVFDLATGSVTLGSTTPDLVFGIPATSAANLEITNGVNMANAITLACTTTATGSTAPTTGLDLTLLFK